MTPLGCGIKPDQQSATISPTFFKTDRNKHEIRCGMCSRIGYIEEETFRFVADAIESGLDSPFRCEVCEEKYDDLAYEG